MCKLSAQITILTTLTAIGWSSSSNLELDCRKDFPLPKPVNLNNAVSCFNDCIKENSTVCYPNRIVQNALLNGFDYYKKLKSFESNLLTKDILAKFTQCGNTSMERGSIDQDVQDAYDASNILEIALGFLGKTVDDRGNADGDNRAYNQFTYRPTSCCMYNTSSVCQDAISVNCNIFKTIRSYNGVCNNLRKIKMGATTTPYYSLINPQYDSKLSNFGTRNSRKLSVLLNSTVRAKYQITEEIPNLVFVWAFQAFDHEIGSLQDYQYQKGVFAPRCCGFIGNRKLPTFFQNHNCMSIQVSPTDPVLGNSGPGCIEFVRAQRVHDACHFARPRFANGVTTPIDGSIIYGSNVNANMDTRDSNMLNFATDDFGKRLFGDDRNSQTANLFVIHDLFANLHDMIVGTLGNYELARKFVGGTMQKIMFDMLATALGKTLTEQYDILNQADCYDLNIPLVTLTEYSHSVGRFGHEFVPDNINFNYQNGTKTTLNLHKLFGLDSVPTEEDTKALIWGMVNQPMKKTGVSYVLQNEFIEGCDLFATDNQREKDAEIEAYIKYLKYYNATCINSFEDLGNFKIMDASDVQILKRTFKNVNDIPLSMGSRLEILGEDGFLPPTVARITIDQMKRLKCGDRYFWTRKDINTEKRITAISRMTIRELICCYGNGFINELPLNSFLTEGPNNPKVPCSCRSVRDILNL